MDLREEDLRWIGRERGGLFVFNLSNVAVTGGMSFGPQRSPLKLIFLPYVLSWIYFPRQNHRKALYFSFLGQRKKIFCKFLTKKKNIKNLRFLALFFLNEEGWIWRNGLAESMEIEVLHFYIRTVCIPGPFLICKFETREQ